MRKKDIQELWCNLVQTLIWCDGLLLQQSKSTRKRPSLDSDSDDEAQHSTKKTKKGEKLLRNALKIRMLLIRNSYTIQNMGRNEIWCTQ